MNTKNTEEIKNDLAEAFAAQARRTFDVLRIQGWEFPDRCDVGITVLKVTPLNVALRVRLDEVTRDLTVRLISPEWDVVDAVDILAEKWLAQHATKRPVAHVRRARSG